MGVFMKLIVLELSPNRLHQLTCVLLWVAMQIEHDIY